MRSEWTAVVVQRVKGIRERMQISLGVQRARRLDADHDIHRLVASIRLQKGRDGPRHPLVVPEAGMGSGGSGRPFQQGRCIGAFFGNRPQDVYTSLGSEVGSHGLAVGLSKTEGQVCCGSSSTDWAGRFWLANYHTDLIDAG